MFSHKNTELNGRVLTYEHDCVKHARHHRLSRLVVAVDQLGETNPRSVVWFPGCCWIRRRCCSSSFMILLHLVWQRQSTWPSINPAAKQAHTPTPTQLCAPSHHNSCDNVNPGLKHWWWWRKSSSEGIEASLWFKWRRKASHSYSFTLSRHLSYYRQEDQQLETLNPEGMRLTPPPPGFYIIHT